MPRYFVGGSLVALALALVVGSEAVAESEYPVKSHSDTGGYARHVVVRSGLAYLADSTALRVVDVGDPRAPTEIWSQPWPGGYAWIDLRGDTLFAVGGEFWGAQSGLHLFNALDPSAPVVIGSFLTPSASLAVEVVGDLAYLAETGASDSVPGGLRILDVSDPTQPFEHGSLLDYPVVSGGDVEGSVGYGISWAGIRLIDVSDPTLPVEIGASDLYPGHHLQVAGSTAYVAEGASSGSSVEGLLVLDVSDPAAPAELGFLSLSHLGGARYVALDLPNSLAYVATGSSVAIVDIQDPSQPVLLGAIPAAGSQSVQVVGDLAYVAAGSSGMRVLGFDLTAPDCRDGLDNDEDGKADDDDPDCESPDEISEGPACSDGVDNDGDGRIDDADPGCNFPDDTSEELDCRDGVDNDGDGDVDTDDPGCLDADDLTEGPDCSDGLDNDGDGLVDLADPGCVVGSDNREDSDPTLQEGDLVLTSGANLLVKIDGDTRDLAVLARPDDAWLADVAVGPGGVLLATDVYHNSVIRIDPVAGTQTTVAVDPRITGFGDSYANFNNAAHPWTRAAGIALEPDGSILVVGETALLRIDPGDGNVTSLAPLGSRGVDVALGPGGVIYATATNAFAFESDVRFDLLQVVPATGQTSVVASDFPLGGNFAGGRLAVEPAGTLLVTTGNDLLRVNPNEGSSSVIATVGQEEPPFTIGGLGGVSVMADGSHWRVEYPGMFCAPFCYRGCSLVCATQSSSLVHEPGLVPGSLYPLTLGQVVVVPAPACSDGLDNDGDGLTDYPDDPGCRDPEWQENPECQDSLDNDDDEFTDLDDPGCAEIFDVSEKEPTLPCDDGADNDADGFTDTRDPGCTGPTDPSETNAAIACDDGADNDADGLVDAADPGCTGPTDPSETNAAIACDDGADNDADGLVARPTPRRPTARWFATTGRTTTATAWSMPPTRAASTRSTPTRPARRWFATMAATTTAMGWWTPSIPAASTRSTPPKGFPCLPPTPSVQPSR
jgi:hypothetical protein